MTVTACVSRLQISIDGRETYYEIVAKGYGKWAVCEGGFCLSRCDDLTDAECVSFNVKPGQKYLFEWEPQPSSRMDEFLARARFDSPEAAQKAFESWLEFAHPILIRWVYKR